MQLAHQNLVHIYIQYAPHPIAAENRSHWGVPGHGRLPPAPPPPGPAVPCTAADGYRLTGNCRLANWVSMQRLYQKELDRGEPWDDDGAGDEADVVGRYNVGRTKFPCR